MQDKFLEYIDSVLQFDGILLEKTESDELQLKMLKQLKDKYLELKPAEPAPVQGPKIYGTETIDRLRIRADFAALAMQAIISNPHIVKQMQDGCPPAECYNNVAQDAVNHADALINMLNKIPSHVK